MKINIVLFFLISPILLFSSRNTFSAEFSTYPRPVVTSNIIQRIFFIQYNKNYGTAFTVDIDNRQYLITAKHVVEHISKNDDITIFFKDKWNTIRVTSLACGDENTDVIVLVPPIVLSPPLEVSVSDNNMIFSQDMYFLGFPYGMTTDGKSINRDFPMPFVKNAILSAIKNDGPNTILYLDGHNNPGFSGGPIVFHDYTTGKLSIAGVVSGYRDDRSRITYKGNETDLVAIGNSGIIIGYSLKPAIDTIKNNSIGPIIGNQKK